MRDDAVKLPRQSASAAAPLVSRSTLTWLVRAVVAVATLIAGGYTVRFTLMHFAYGHWHWREHIDLLVYRAGGADVLHDISLYGPRAVVVGVRHWDLPFTYPPFAAIIMTPLAKMPPWLCGVLMSGLCWAMMAIAIGVIASRLGVVRRLAVIDKVLLFFVVGVVAMWFEPIRANFQFGQISLVLATFMIIDGLAPQPRWSRGILTGLATAIKLTPAVMIAWFLLKRDWRAAANMTITLGVCTGLAFLISPSDSRKYWTDVLPNDGRIGSQLSALNQAMTGLMARAGMSFDQRSHVWNLVVIPVVVVMVAIGWLLLVRGQEVLAMCVVALIAAVASPIAWAHHWFIGTALIFIMVTLAVTQRRWILLIPAAIGVAAQIPGPYYLLPHGRGLERNYTTWQLLYSDGYLIWLTFTVLLLGALCVFRLGWLPWQSFVTADARPLRTEFGNFTRELTGRGPQPPAAA